MKKIQYLFLFTLLAITLSCISSSESPKEKTESITNKEELKTAYFASGCFWCVEAIFENVKGVEEVISGYSGGIKKNPTYREICTGTLRHAESVLVYYNPKVINYKTLLKVFFGSHDPTTVNRQGNDAGPQYRSIVFYQTEEEKIMCEDYIKELDELKMFTSKIVTEVVPFDIFYPAEDYHQNYEKNHPNDSYVKAISIPRLLRFEDKFPELLKQKH